MPGETIFQKRSVHINTGQLYDRISDFAESQNQKRCTNAIST